MRVLSVVCVLNIWAMVYMSMATARINGKAGWLSIRLLACAIRWLIMGSSIFDILYLLCFYIPH